MKTKPDKIVCDNFYGAINCSLCVLNRTVETVLTATEIITTEVTTISLYTAQTDHNTTTVLLLRIIAFLIVIIVLGLGCFLFSKRHKIMEKFKGPNRPDTLFAEMG